MRRQLSRSKSARVFRRGTAVKKVNHQPTMGRRGGIRL